MTPDNITSDNWTLLCSVIDDTTPDDMILDNLTLLCSVIDDMISLNSVQFLCVVFLFPFTLEGA